MSLKHLLQGITVRFSLPRASFSHKMDFWWCSSRWFVYVLSVLDHYYQISGCRCPFSVNPVVPYQLPVLMILVEFCFISFLWAGSFFPFFSCIIESCCIWTITMKGFIALIILVSYSQPVFLFINFFCFSCIIESCCISKDHYNESY